MKYLDAISKITEWSLQMVTAAMKLKDAYSLKEKKNLAYQTNSFVDIIEQYAFSYRINLGENIVY